MAGTLGASLWTSLAPLATAVELAPARFIPDHNARAVAATTSLESESVERGDWNARGESGGSAFERESSGGVLRWRVKQPGQGSSSSARVVAEAPAKTKVAAALSRGYASQVRQAVVQGEDSPFQNPFGDKYAMRQAQADGPIEAEPMDLKQPGTQPPADAPDPADEPAPAPRFQSPARPLMPMPMRRPAPPVEEELQPMPEPNENMRPNAKYNERNCDQEGKNCADNRLRLKSDILIDKNDLLDITPPLALSTDSQQQIERSKENFQRIPAREWRDRTGRLVATGRLMIVAYRNATIKDESGAEVKIPLNQLGDDEQCFLAGWWNVPSECTLGDEVHPGRDFVATNMTWTASALCHKPLYFEEVQLERYGHTAGLFQPAISGAHFFVNIAVLPYRMGINPPNECQYTLGYYRPGSCAPWLVPPIPLSIRGAATQAAAIGIVYPLIP